MFRRVFKTLKASIFALLSVVIIYLLAALVFSLIPTHPLNTNCSQTKDIFIVSNGVHVDIILPVENIEPEFLNKLGVEKETKFVAFGWGDKEFYINTPEWSDLTFSTTFRALFLKSKTAMHVTSYQDLYYSWEKLKLCKLQLNGLNQYIENSFIKTENGYLNKNDIEGYNNYDSFYDARGTFTIFRTCNVWVNNAFKEIGVRTSVWSPFCFGILYHVPD